MGQLRPGEAAGLIIVGILILAVVGAITLAGACIAFLVWALTR